MAVSFKEALFPQDIMRMGVRWYVAYPLSTRHVGELMLERGVHVDHSTINRWVVKYSPQAAHRVAASAARRAARLQERGSRPWPSPTPSAP